MTTSAINRYAFRQLDSTKSPAAGGDVIGKCGALLDNRMQCTRAGEYEVTDAENPDKLMQVCKRHAVIMESEGRNYQPKVEPAQPEKPAVEKNTPPDVSAPVDPSAANPAQTQPKTVAQVLGQKTN